MTGADLLIQCLRAQGIDTLFGMPGTQNLAIYDALYRADRPIRHILVRNEQAATMMAGGWARATGQMGVALTVPGPGASNASTGIADAYTDCQPVLLVTGGVDRPLHRRDRAKMFHGLDQETFFRPITRYYGCPQTAADIPHMVRSACEAMWADRPGPAVLEIPPDLAAEECSSLPPIPTVVEVPPPQPPDATQVQAAAELIGTWKQPLLLAGGDVIAADATGELRQMAEHLEAPLVHTRLGKGVAPSDFGLNCGHTLGPRAQRLLKSADGLIAVGVRFTQIDTANWTLPLPESMVQLDRDPREIGREFPTTVGIVGDLAASLRDLQTALPPGNAHRWSDAALADLEHPPTPGPFLRQVRAALPPHAIVVSDVTSLTYRAFDEYPTEGTRDFLYPCHYVTLGYGLPAAIGAQTACPDRPVVALCGDGGAMMSIGELSTASQHQIPLVVVVISDQALLAIKASQIKGYQNRILGTELQNPDFVALAESMGVAAQRTADLDEFAEFLAAALEDQRPRLIEIAMDGHQQEIIDQIPWL